MKNVKVRQELLGDCEDIGTSPAIDVRNWEKK